jgi:hypothetical protein
MWKMKGKVPRVRERPTPFLAQESAKQPGEPGAGGLAAAHPGSVERVVMVSRIRRFSPWLVALVTAAPLAAVPLAPAGAQNLDAGKPASQIFSEVCANCHRSARELKGNASASFLREHYTTGSEMASTMAAYLAGGAGGGDQRAPGAAQPKRPPNPTGSPVAGTPPATPTGRDAPAPDAANPKRAQQTPDPKASPASAGSPKGRPARAEGTAEAKPLASAPPASVRPALEEFEE